jgi:hypothetical protein
MRRFAPAVLLALAALPAFAQISDDDAEAACGIAACGAFVLLPILIGAIVTIGVTVWIAMDARKRNDPNWILWAVIGFLFNIIGLIIYLVVRSKEGPRPPAPMPPPPPPYVNDPPPPPPPTVP